MKFEQKYDVSTLASVRVTDHQVVKFSSNRWHSESISLTPNRETIRGKITIVAHNINLRRRGCE